MEYKNKNVSVVEKTVKTGIGFGSALATLHGNQLVGQFCMVY